jgi:hypothetical protein
MVSRYLAAAHDASSAGDRVLCEYNMQFAEHYSRVIADKFKIVKKRRKKPDSKPEKADYPVA